MSLKSPTEVIINGTCNELQGSYGKAWSVTFPGWTRNMIGRKKGWESDSTFILLKNQINLCIYLLYSSFHSTMSSHSFNKYLFDNYYTAGNLLGAWFQKSYQWCQMRIIHLAALENHLSHFLFSTCSFYAHFDECHGPSKSSTTVLIRQGGAGGNSGESEK